MTIIRKPGSAGVVAGLAVGFANPAPTSSDPSKFPSFPFTLAKVSQAFVGRPLAAPRGSGPLEVLVVDGSRPVSTPPPAPVREDVYDRVAVV